MKKQYTFTIEENIYKEFNDLSKKNSINKSLFIENCLLDYLKNDKNKNGNK
jgi:metal-responsive CopG/Arc/MetJ family transcriptional regulator